MPTPIMDIDAMHLPLKTEFVFNATNDNWSRKPEHNLFFLQGVQNMYNDILQARGYIFLNEVLRGLGIRETRAGQIVGWMLTPAGGYVDFGIAPDADGRSIYLTFNINGTVLFELEA